MGKRYLIETRITGIEDGQAGDPPLRYRYPMTATAWVERDYSIADATTQNAWDPLAVDNEVVSDFDLLIVRSDQTVHLEEVVDDGGEVGKVVFSQPIVKDLPFMLGADDSYANPGADDAFSGTLDLIERLRIRNDSGSTAAVKIILAT